MSQLPPPLAPLPYAGPESRAAGRGVFSVGLFLWSEAILIGWMSILVFVVPKLQEVFQDFKVAVPLATVMLFKISQVVTYGGFVVILLIPVGIGFLAGPLSPAGRRAARIVLTLVMALLVVFTILGLFQPLMTLMEGMNSGSGKR